MSPKLGNIVGLFFGAAGISVGVSVAFPHASDLLSWSVFLLIVSAGLFALKED